MKVRDGEGAGERDGVSNEGRSCGEKIEKRMK